MQLDFRVIVDDVSHESLDLVFQRYWPAYEHWMRRSPPRESGHCALQLREHMPELVGPFQRLLGRFGGSDQVARFLTQYDPPRLVRACTQLVVDSGDGPRLFRSYDHHPRLFDGVILSSRWGEVKTLAMTDCLWGALDGVNAHGLVVALAFGGRNVVGRGFAAPLICRYVLETCATVAQARQMLNRLPVYMPYTFVIVDATGAFVTAYLGPDRPPTFVERRASANHQGEIEWPAFARFCGSAARLECAETLLEGAGDPAAVRRSFLLPPLWRPDYARASGTLYVAEYSPKNRTLDLHWPGTTERLDISEAHDRMFSVQLPQLISG